MGVGVGLEMRVGEEGGREGVAKMAQGAGETREAVGVVQMKGLIGNSFSGVGVLAAFVHFFCFWGFRRRI